MVLEMRARAAQARREIAMLQKQIATLQASVARGNRAGANSRKAFQVEAISRWGNQIQWAGRQLQYNFSLPIALAMGASTKFALENERALVRIQKVYGDGAHGADFYSKEIDALGEAFKRLSEKFGVSQSATLDIAAGWAAAGASGIALAKSTELTLQTMILGELEAVEATEALIAIQAQYGQNTEQLTKTIDTMNMVENQTGISMKGLIQGMQRSAGVARTAGVDVQHLTAMLAAMSPAAGSAAQAGNGLKTMISRLMSPTKDAAELMAQMGINTKDIGWQSMNAVQRLEALARAYDKSNDAQKAAAVSTLFSRWQINRADVLMKELIDTNGYYQKALRSTASDAQNAQQKQYELNKVLDSSPKKLQQIWVILQNSLADAIQPMIPALLMLASGVARIGQWFTKLSPQIQKTVLALLVFLAAIGPVARYIGSVSNLIGLMTEASHFFGRKFHAVGKLMTSVVKGPFSLVGKAFFVMRTQAMLTGAFIGKALLAPWRPLLIGTQRMLGLYIGAHRTSRGMISALWFSSLTNLAKMERLFWASLIKPMKWHLQVWFAHHGLLLTGWKQFRVSLLMMNTSMWGLLVKPFPAFYGAHGKLFTAITGLWAAFSTKVVALSTKMWAWLITPISFYTGAHRTSQSRIVVAFTSFRAAMIALNSSMITKMSLMWVAMGTVVPKTFAKIGLVFAKIGPALMAGFMAVNGLLIKAFLGLGPLLVRVMIGTNALLVKAFVLVGPMLAHAVAVIFVRLIGVIKIYGPLLMKAVLSPWTFAVLAVLGLLYTFRDDVRKIWNDVVAWFQANAGGIAGAFKPVGRFFDRIIDWIVDAFWKLPEGVTGALVTVIKIVQKAAMKIYEWLSYLNPFARHSPSLVDSVTAGMAEIQKQYASAANVGSVFKRAARDLAAFKAATAGMGGGEFDDVGADIAKAFPNITPLFNALIGDLAELNQVLAVQESAVAAQQAVVDNWEAALDAANAKVDLQEAKLDSLTQTLNALEDSYDSHAEALQAFADSPLKGMDAFSDAMFANEIAQKKLRLEMLKWEEINGPIEDVRDRLASMYGDIEELRGTAADLRSAGAGSDVLGPIMAEIEAMEAQAKALESTVRNSPVSSMQDELKALQLEAEKLDLQQAIKFDPLTRAIEELVDTRKELTFDQVVAGIKTEQAAMAALTPQIDAARVAVEKQQLAVDAAKASRDAISATYDTERAKLDILTDAYSRTEDAIRSIKDALQGMGTIASEEINKAEAAARKAKDALGGANNLPPGTQNYVDAAGAADFPDVSGGEGILGREGSIEDQSALIDEYTKGLADDIEAAMGEFDIFAPFKRWWNIAWTWIKENIGSKIQPILDTVHEWVGKIKIPNPFESNADWAKQFRDVFDTIMDVATSLKDGLKEIFDLFAPDIKRIWDAIIAAGKKIWTEIGPELEKFKEPLSKMGEAFKGLWTLLKPIVAIIGGALLLAFKIVAGVISSVFGPVLETIISLIKAVIKIFRGIVEFLVGTFSGDLSMAVGGIGTIFSGMWDFIFGLFEGAWDILWGIVEGIVTGIVEWLQKLKDLAGEKVREFVEGVVDWFKELWDKLVGHSIVPDIVNDIIDWIKKLPGKAWEALSEFSKKLVDRVSTGFDDFKTKAGEKWDDFTKWVKERPGKMWDALSELGTKLKDRASKAFGDFKTAAVEKWDKSILPWIKGIPGYIWNSLYTLLPDKLVNLARDGFNAFVNKVKDIIDGKKGFMDYIRGIPGAIGKVLGGVGSTIAGALKTAWNSTANWINKNGIANVNKVTSKFGFKINNLPTFAGGGVIPGRVSQKDNTIIAARTGEGVIVPELVRHLGGARGLAALNQAAQSGSRGKLSELGVPGYADGGVIGNWLKKGAGHALSMIIKPFEEGVKSVIPGKPFVEDWAVGAIRGWRKAAEQWGQAQDVAGNKKLPNTGGWPYMAMIDILRSKFPDIQITSTYRPGAITASGNASYHGMGRAVDMAPSMKYFDWLYTNYGKSSKEIIYSPAGRRQIKDGQHFTYGEPVKSMHYNHVHWAYDQGGVLKPGLTMAYNGTGRDEYVLTNDAFMSLSNVLRMVGDNLSKRPSASLPGSAAMLRMTATTRSLEARLRQQESKAQDRVYGTTHIGKQININGNLEFPNVKSGNDAEAFIKNLERLAGE